MSKSDSGDFDDLDSLIKASAKEEMVDELLADTAAPSSPTPQPAARINHRTTVLGAWMICLFVAALLFLNPLISEADLGSRSLEARLGVAMYHVAHRIESYRYVVGELPDFLDASWGDLDRFFDGSDAVKYVKTDEGYYLVGRAGELEVVYRQGQDPEALLLNIIRFEERAP